jgi:hypothetical protein
MRPPPDGRRPPSSKLSLKITVLWADDEIERTTMKQKAAKRRQSEAESVVS